MNAQQVGDGVATDLISIFEGSSAQFTLDALVVVRRAICAREHELRNLLACERLRDTIPAPAPDGEEASP